MQIMYVILSHLPQAFLRKAYNVLRDYFHPPITDVVLHGCSLPLSACHWMLSHDGVPVEVDNDEGTAASVEVEGDHLEDPLAMMVACAHAARCLPSDPIFQAQILGATAGLLYNPTTVKDVVCASDPDGEDEWMLGADQPTVLDFTAYACLPASTEDAPQLERLRQRVDLLMQPWKSSSPSTESE